MDAEKNLQAYEQDVNAEQTIRDAVLDSYNSFKPELEMVANYEQSQLPSFYGSFNGYNTGAQQLSVADQLQKAWSEAGRRASTAQVARGVLDVRKQRAEDLIGQGLNQWNQGYQGAQNAYNRWFQQKQFDEQVRQFNAQLARSGSGGYGGINIPGTQTPERDEKLYSMIDMINGAMARNAGADKFVSPDTYRYLRSQWISSGFSGNEFDDNWGGRVNVNNPNSRDYFDPWNKNFTPNLK